MNSMKDQSFQYNFTTSKNRNDVFNYLLDPKNWWVGLFGETIEGTSRQLNDEFTFSAGDGVHYSCQKLVELVPDKNITWLVTESNLSFLKKTNEWSGTKIRFDIEDKNGSTTVTFTHDGLVPAFECYHECSNAWAQYLQNMRKHFQ
jgi:hypothetical protein